MAVTLYYLFFKEIMHEKLRDLKRFLLLKINIMK
jgi:hypothetical protein